MGWYEVRKRGTMVRSGEVLVSTSGRQRWSWALAS